MNKNIYGYFFSAIVWGYLSFFSSFLLAETRTALVIGNGGYQGISALKNPPNDARAIAAALQTTGFTVDLKIDASQEEMETAIRDFGNALHSGGVGMFYFAGHGLQVKGSNYLIPIGAGPQIKSETDVRYKAVDMGLVLDSMDAARNGLNIIVLDACRNNPFARSFRSITPGGLSKVQGPKGTLIAFATEPGDVALDGEGENSPYTKHLVRSIETPGLALEQTFKQVLQGVDKETSGQQTPWISSSFVGDFYFAAKSEDSSTPTVPVATTAAKVVDVKKEHAVQEEKTVLEPEALAAPVHEKRDEKKPVNDSSDSLFSDDDEY